MNEIGEIGKDGEIGEQYAAFSNYRFKDDMPNQSETQPTDTRAQYGVMSTPNPAQNRMHSSTIDNSQSPFQADSSPKDKDAAQNSSQQLLKFQKELLQILSKFSQSHTLPQGIEELKRLMANDITDNDRMLMFLNSLTDFNAHVKVPQMKEQIKMFGVAAEVFEEAFVPFLGKVLGCLQKQIREDATSRLHQAIAETVGQLVFNILDELESNDE